MVTLDDIKSEYVKVNFAELPQFMSKADWEGLHGESFIRIAAKTILVKGITSGHPWRTLRITLSSMLRLGIVIGMKIANPERHEKVSPGTPSTNSGGETELVILSGWSNFGDLQS